MTTSSITGLTGMRSRLSTKNPGAVGYLAAKHAVVGPMRGYAKRPRGEEHSRRTRYTRVLQPPQSSPTTRWGSYWPMCPSTCRCSSTC